jgi:hypothetical protein|tara:strand:- start:70 stop:726 length:657 start_codon:yes stop_codon:yes gene_type:complete
MIITGVDHSHEDLLEWWLKNVYKHHNYNVEVGVMDFGMSPALRGRLEDNYPATFSRPFNGTKARKIGWFYKVQAVMDCPSKSVCWLDVDCEILTDISDVYNLVPPGMIGLTRDWVRGNWWATGVIVVNDRPSLLEHWDRRLNADDGIRGDQEALYELVGNKEHEQIQELPQDYQWLRISLNKGKDSPTKKVIHWTGPRGKQFIRDHLMKGGTFKGQQV